MSVGQYCAQQAVRTSWWQAVIVWLCVCCLISATTVRAYYVPPQHSTQSYITSSHLSSSQQVCQPTLDHVAGRHSTAPFPLLARRSRRHLVPNVNNVDTYLQCIQHFDFQQVAWSGGIAGGCRALSRILTYPFDTVKTLEQSEATQRPVKVDYFRGVFLSVTSAIPANAIFFVVYYFLEYFYQHCQGSSSESIESTSLWYRMLFSMIATLPQNLIKIPAELIKQRAQLSPTVPITQIILDAVQRDQQGWKGLYVGTGAQLLRELPYNAFQMAFHEYLQDQHYPLLVNVDKREVAAGLGLIASSLAAVLTQPSDCLKTVLMTAHPAKSSSTTRSPLDNIPIIAAAKELYEKSGWQGFFAGLFPRLMIVSIGGTVYFFAAEYVNEAIR